MDKKLSSLEIIFAVIFFVLLMAYIHFAQSFFEKNYLWIILCLIYFLFFITHDQLLKEKEICDRLKTKETKDIRIDFWN